MNAIALVAALLVGSSGVLFGSMTWAAEPAPLLLETKIPLGDVKGRIDHLAVDLDRQCLFVAELGNNRVGVVDIEARKVIHTISGLSEPQGVAYVPSTDTVYAANAGDGSVHLYQGADLSRSGRIELGDDADNIRVDAQHGRVFVGYGRGALAVIDPASASKVADIPLKAHPESFQLDHTGTEIFVNVPDARQIAVVDLATGKQTSSLPTGSARSNVPMETPVGAVFLSATQALKARQ